MHLKSENLTANSGIMPFKAEIASKSALEMNSCDQINNIFFKPFILITLFINLSNGILFHWIWVNANRPIGKIEIIFVWQKKSVHCALSHAWMLFWSIRRDIVWISCQNDKKGSNKKKKNNKSNAFAALFALDYVLEFYRIKSMLHICQWKAHNRAKTKGNV